jgi:hypothetical protein
MQPPPDQETSGCLKPILLHGLMLALFCFVWYLLVGRKGLLIGIGQYVVMLSGKAFLRVFGKAEKR